jgi:hypothetical protein
MPATDISVVDRHRFDDDPNPDPTFHIDVDPDQDLDPIPSFTHVGKSAVVFIVIFLVSVIGVIIFNILYRLQKLQFSGR